MFGLMSIQDTIIVILAAGKGTRMGLDVPKVLAPLAGKPMLEHLIDAVDESQVDGKPIVVYGYGAESVCELVKDRAVCVLQERQLGTGHAVSTTREACKGAKRVIVFYGDHPLVSAQTIRRIAEYHVQKPCPILLAVGTVETYTGWQSAFQGFGRILRSENHLIHAIREYKDATEEEREIKEINPGYYVFDADWLWQHIDRVQNDNVQEEYYLTDLVQMAVNEGLPVRTYPIPIHECIGVNRQDELRIAENLLQDEAK